MGFLHSKQYKQHRWHDGKGHLSSMIDLLEKLPDVLIPVITQGVNGRAESKLQADKLLKSVGREKILALYKAKQKQRRYDQNPETHKAVSYFFALSDEQQQHFALECLYYSQTIIEYISNAQKFYGAPKPQDLKDIADLFVRRGSTEVRKYVRERYPEFDFNEHLVFDSDGLRLHRTKNEETA